MELEDYMLTITRLLDCAHKDLSSAEYSRLLETVDLMVLRRQQEEKGA